MKQKDLALILIVVFISVVVSIFVSGYLFNPPTGRQTKVEIAEKIDPNFPQPDPTYFNTNATDPTPLITIGNSSNKAPFNDATNK